MWLDKNEIISDLTFEINQGEFETNLVDLRRHTGYVVQSIGLFPHMTIAQNIAVTPNLLGGDKEKINTTVNNMLTQVGLDPKEYSGHYPHSYLVVSSKESVWRELYQQIHQLCFLMILFQHQMRLFVKIYNKK